MWQFHARGLDPRWQCRKWLLFVIFISQVDLLLYECKGKVGRKQHIEQESKGSHYSFTSTPFKSNSSKGWTRRDLQWAETNTSRSLAFSSVPRKRAHNMVIRHTGH